MGNCRKRERSSMHRRYEEVHATTNLRVPDIFSSFQGLFFRDLLGFIQRFLLRFGINLENEGIINPEGIPGFTFLGSILL